MNKGKRFIVFEGIDGSGKSTQFRRFEDFLKKRKYDFISVREPGGTNIGEGIRRILLDPANTEMSLNTEMLLYMASRAQLLNQRVIPALEKGKFVLGDRFIYSTLAYQGFAGGLSREAIMDVSKIVVGNYMPGLAIFYDVSPEVAAGRLNPLVDRIESQGLEFQRRVRKGYLALAVQDPERIKVINIDGLDVDKVHSRTVEIFDDYLKRLGT